MTWTLVPMQSAVATISKTASTAFTVSVDTNNNLLVNDYILVSFAFDNTTATAPTVAYQSRGGGTSMTTVSSAATYSDSPVAAAAGGVRTAFILIRVTAASTTALTSLTFAFSASITAKVGACMRLRGGDATSNAYNVVPESAVAGGAFTSPSINNPSGSGEYLRITIHGNESSAAPNVWSGTVVISGSTTGGSGVTNIGLQMGANIGSGSPVSFGSGGSTAVDDESRQLIVFGNSASAGSVTVTATGFNDASVVGSPTVSGVLSTAPTGVASTEAHGTQVATQAIPAITCTPTGIATGEVVGAPTISTVVATGPTGVVTGQAVGNPSTTTLLATSPTGVGSAEGMGSPTATVISPVLTASPAAIATSEAMGTQSVSTVLTAMPSSILTALAFGNSTVSTVLTSSPSGLASAEIVGAQSVSTVLTVTASGVASVEALGSPTGTITPPATTVSPTGFGGVWSNPTLFDSWDATTLALNDGDSVATWGSVSQADATKRPVYKTNILNGKPVVRFDANDYMDQASGLQGTTMTMALVRNVTVAGTTVQMWNGTNGNGGGPIHYVGDRAIYLRSAGIPTDGAVPLATWERWIIVFNTTSTQLWVNGTLVINSNIPMNPTGVGSFIRLGGSDGSPEFLSGSMDLAESRLYSSALSNADVSSLDSQLQSKWFGSGGEAFGSPTATVLSGGTTVSPTAIASLEASGPPIISTVLVSAPPGAPSGELLGFPAASTVLATSPAGMGSNQALGVPSVNTVLVSSPVGVATAQVLGSPTVTGLLSVSPISIASAEALGFLAASTIINLVALGIVSGEALGTPTASIVGGALTTAQPSSIGSAEALGLPSVSSLLVVGVTAIPTGEVVGVPALSGALSASPVGVASLVAVGTPVVSVGLSVAPVGIATGESFGALVVQKLLISSPASITSALAFGLAVANAQQNATPIGVSSALAFGSPTGSVVLGTVPLSIATAAAFGTAVVTNKLTSFPSGVGSEEFVGTHNMSGQLNVMPSAIGSLAVVGNLSVQNSITVGVSGIFSGEAWGSPIATLIGSSVGEPGARKPQAHIDPDGFTAEIIGYSTAGINPGTTTARRNDGNYRARITQA